MSTRSKNRKLKAEENANSNISLGEAIPAEKFDPDAEREAQKRMSILGFAFIGLLMGFLWGANSLVQVASSDSCLVQAARVSIAIATNTAQWGRGLVMGLGGMAIGGLFGLSISFGPKKSPNSAN